MIEVFLLKINFVTEQQSFSCLSTKSLTYSFYEVCLQNPATTFPTLSLTKTATLSIKRGLQNVLPQAT